MEYTKGQWSAKPLTGGRSKFHIIADADTDHYQYVATVDRFAASQDELEADARLIAAAPDMYKALKEIVDSLYDAVLPADTLRLLYPWLTKAKTIVDKAEGK